MPNDEKNKTISFSLEEESIVAVDKRSKKYHSRMSVQEVGRLGVEAATEKYDHEKISRKEGEIHTKQNNR